MKTNSSLNHVFRLIWNQSIGAWVAVAETTRGRGKASSVGSGVASAVLGAASLGLMLLGTPAQAAPAGGQVTAGSGSVSHSGATTTVKQNSAALSLSWQSFNIGKSETVNFVQPTAKSIAVNRILDTNGSQILGRLNANGQVWLINPNGLLFGRGAQVNVGGLVASTLDVSDDSLSGSTHRFAGDSTAGVINQGHISASEGGSVVLLGHHVSNTGTISAQLGTVALAAGNATTLQFEGSRLVNLRVDDNLLDALADNGGLLQADGGQVLMSAGARNSVLASVVNNTGVIEARTVEQSEGRIVLLGGMAAGTTHVAGTLDASAPSGGNGGFIETSAAHVQVADGTRITTAAPRGQTGTWLIDPTDFTVAAGSAALTSSGIGADTLSTSLGSTSVTIATDNLNGNDAGDINVNSSVSWSANTLTLSAYNNININAALNGSGTASLAFEYGQGAVALNNTSRYNINAPVSLPAGDHFSTKQGSDGTVQGWKVITDLGLSGSTTGTDLQGINLSGHYVLGADIDASDTALWNAGAGFAPIGTEPSRFTGNFNGLGHTIDHLTINRAPDYLGLFGYADAGSEIRNVGLTDVANYTSATPENGNANPNWDFTNTWYVVDGSTRPFLRMEYSTTISNAHQLQLMGMDLTAHYTLANNIDLAAELADKSGMWGGSAAGFAPIGIDYASRFTGSFDGQGHTIGHLTINRLDKDFVGLFGYAGAGSAISDVGLTDASVAGPDLVGALVGISLGTITNSYATGSVSGTTYVGGLVGINDGIVTNSYWNITSTGQTSSAGGVGLTQAQMTSAASYDGWDFDNTWVVYEGHTAPLLRSFMTALTVTVDYGEGATKVYDATTVYNGGTVVSYSLDDADTARIYGDVTGTLSSSHVGSRTVTADGGLYSDQQGYIISYDTSANNTVQVTPATLTYRANAASFFNGQTPIGLSGTITGWMGDDTLASATCGCISWTTSALSSSYPGYYDITGGGLTASDYVFVQAAGNATALTLNPARLPDEVSAVTTQVTSTLPIIRDENGIGLASPRRDPGWRAVGLGVRLPDDAVSSEVTP